MNQNINTDEKKYKKYYLPAIIAGTAFVLGVGLSALTNRSSAADGVAVVNVAQVVSQAEMIIELQQQQQGKNQELQKWLADAQADVDKQKSKQKKDELTQKYAAELIQKQQTMQQEYNQKLQEIDAKITKIIVTEAKAEGYDMVLAKSSVIYGGTDITNQIIEMVKPLPSKQ